MWMTCEKIIINKRKYPGKQIAMLFSYLKYFLSAVCILFFSLPGDAQLKDTLPFVILKEIKVVGYKTINGIGHFNEVHGPVIYAGKKLK